MLLFDSSEAQPQISPEKHPSGIYGPSDDGSPMNRPEAPDLNPSKYYDVCVKKDCEEDDIDADR